MARNPKIVAIVVGANDGVWLRSCLRTLLNSRVSSLSVVYVDNASTDGSADLVHHEFPDVQVIRSQRNLGFAGGNNLAIRSAMEVADYVFLVNPDTRTPPELLARLVAFLERHRSYGIVGPLQYNYQKDERSFCTAGLNAWSRQALADGERHEFAYHFQSRASDAGPVEGRAPGALEHAYVQGAALFASVAVLRQSGLFDPAYHSYYEELDLCRRVRWCGYRVALLLDLGIEHHGGGSTTGTRYRNYHMLRNKYYYLWTDPTWKIGDVAVLTWRWLRFDLRMLFRPRPRDYIQVRWNTATPAFVWLLRQVPRIWALRRAHHRLITLGSSR